jgi:diguanylate cyclase (GGDEF)-like protein/PAS domain S-box-containing protein
MHPNEVVAPSRLRLPHPAEPQHVGTELQALHSALDAGAPVADALVALCRLVEARLPGAVCAVMMASAQGDAVRCVAGPNLPPGYAAAIDDTPIVAGAGSCSSAIRSGAPVVATDIAEDPRWSDWRELALAYGFHSCVASPIRDERGAILGSFDVYMRGLREPAPLDVELSRAAAQLAGLALEHSEARRSLMRAKSRFETLANGLPTPFGVLDGNGTFIHVNPTFANHFGRAPADWEGRALRDLVGDLSHVALLSKLERSSATATVEFDGDALVGPTRRPVRLSLTACRDETGRVDTIHLHARDPSWVDSGAGRQRAARIAQAVESTNLAFFEIDIARRSVEFSDRFAGMLGEHRGTRLVALSNYLERVHPDDRRTVVRRFMSVMRGDAGDLGVEHRVRDAHGQWVWLLANGKVVETDPAGRATRLAGAVTDVSERHKSEQYIHQLAYHDPLTGLPNRRMYQLSLERTVRRAQRDQRDVALICLGLDRFRRINDVAGHAAGDRVIQEMARRLQAAAPEGDLVCRPGSDEFALICDRGLPVEAVAELARTLCAALAEPLPVAERELRVTASAGFSMYPQDSADAGDLMRNAGIALQRAKGHGRTHQIRAYSAHMDALAAQRLTLECQLRDALARGEMTLYYQPVVDAARDAVLGVEALMRWRHPEHGVVLPERFLPIAEDAGLDNELGAWALQAACRQGQAWLDQGLPALRIAVNVSGRHLSGAVVEHVAAALSETGWPAELLQLEISEAALGHDLRLSARVLDRLKMLGVRLAVDDFGVAGSSLTALKHFPLDVLKIDRSFVHELGTSDADAAIVDAIVALSRALAFDVIAEGVEREDQRTLLRDRGVDGWQGYLVVSPMPADACARWLLDRIAKTRGHAGG